MEISNVASFITLKVSLPFLVLIKNLLSPRLLQDVISSVFRHVIVRSMEKTSFDLQTDPSRLLLRVGECENKGELSISCTRAAATGRFQRALGVTRPRALSSACSPQMQGTGVRLMLQLGKPFISKKKERKDRRETRVKSETFLEARDDYQRMSSFRFHSLSWISFIFPKRIRGGCGKRIKVPCGYCETQDILMYSEFCWRHSSILCTEVLFCITRNTSTPKSQFWFLINIKVMLRHY